MVTERETLVDVEAEIIERLTEDDHIASMTREILSDIVAGNLDDVYRWGFALACLTEYRARGGDISCPMDAPAAAVRILLSQTVEVLDRTRSASTSDTINQMHDIAAVVRQVLERG